MFQYLRLKKYGHFEKIRVQGNNAGIQKKKLTLKKWVVYISNLSILLLLLYHLYLH